MNKDIITMDNAGKALATTNDLIKKTNEILDISLEALVLVEKFHNVTLAWMQLLKASANIAEINNRLAKRVEAIVKEERYDKKRNLFLVKK